MRHHKKFIDFAVWFHKNCSASLARKVGKHQQHLFRLKKNGFSNNVAVFYSLCDHLNNNASAFMCEIKYINYLYISRRFQGKTLNDLSLACDVPLHVIKEILKTKSTSIILFIKLYKIYNLSIKH